MPTSAQAQGPHTYAISFTPRQPNIHTVHLRFNNHDVPGKVIPNKQNYTKFDGFIVRFCLGLL